VRILLVHGGDVSVPGGLETHVRELANQLADRGHEVALYGRPAALSPFTMTLAADPGRYDVIHHHTGAWPGVPPLGPGAVRTIHFCTAAKMAIYVRRGRLRTLVNPGNWRAVRDERAACRRGWRLITVSRRVSEECARHYGLDPARAEVISNGASFAPPSESRAALRERYGLAPEAPVLLTIGRADFVKGYGLLERAWSRVDPAARGACWVRVGGTTRSREAARLVTGPVAHREALDWIHAADFGALPSLSEGCSVALLEMLAGRLYTLSHDVGNAIDVVRPGVNGEIVPDRLDSWVEALRRILERPPARPAVGLGVEYGWPAIAERVEAVYREALGGAR
jgi:glycosyltransferase involved in cell wall biosynthesis